MPQHEQGRQKSSQRSVYSRFSVFLISVVGMHTFLPQSVGQAGAQSVGQLPPIGPAAAANTRLSRPQIAAASVKCVFILISGDSFILPDWFLPSLGLVTGHW